MIDLGFKNWKPQDVDVQVRHRGLRPNPIDEFDWEDEFECVPDKDVDFSWEDGDTSFRIAFKINGREYCVFINPADLNEPVDDMGDPKRYPAS